MIEKLRILARSMGSPTLSAVPVGGFGRTHGTAVHKTAGWGGGQPPLALPTVANIKSQKKRILTNAKRADRNKAVKSELRTRVKNAEQAAGSADADVSLRLAVKRLDMAASKGIIHPNAAARRKSRLMKKLAAK